MSPPPTQEIRPFGNGLVSVERREKILRINWALGTASIWKLKIVGSLNMNAQPAWIRNNTNRGRCQVVEDDTHGTNRGLGEARVAEADLLEQISVVTQHCGGILRARERRDGVSLETGAVIGQWMIQFGSKVDRRCFQ